MQNTIKIKNDSFYTIENNDGEDAVIVQFMDVSAAEGLEVYQGNEFYQSIECEVVNNQITATLPQEIFTGSNIHFRLATSSGFSPFFHIIYNPAMAFQFSGYNYVVCGNEALN